MNDVLKGLNELIEKIGPDKISSESLELLIKTYTSSEEDGESRNTYNEENVHIDLNVKKKSKKAGIVTRPLELEEFTKIINLLNTGFYYDNEKGKKSYFRPQPNVALALSLEATLGLRISDILKLKVKNFQKDKLEVLEKKTNKLQYRAIDARISEYIRDYALEHNLTLNDNLITVKTRWIQDRLKIISKYLGLTNIGTHSFRKLFAMDVYNKSGDIDLVKSLLNHSSVTVTQRYLKTNQTKIDEYSKSINFLPHNN
ncbi:tyrosine-type recombinase/integrase [Clostridium butyricum]|uniref:tyrosine-type recombinase/integrase n=1 Tax=Clostridium butyricum TaxID=1492 RepID=UPI002AB14487|nr:tyrosine-type recombinase/integrase [Clostridium butyricum]